MQAFEIAKHPKVLEKAYEAGFRVMLMGIESPHDKVLNLYNKGFTRKDIEESLQFYQHFLLLSWLFYIRQYWRDRGGNALYP